jgi:hypothetical protein
VVVESRGPLWPLGRPQIIVAYSSPPQYLGTFKRCLQQAIADPRKRLSERLDLAGWRELPGFGGDQILAKKIVSVYFLDTTLPIFNTKRLECYCKQLGIDPELQSSSEFQKPYVQLSTGQKWELLTGAILSCYEDWRGAATGDRRKELSYLMKVIATVFEECNE